MMLGFAARSTVALLSALAIGACAPTSVQQSVGEPAHAAAADIAPKPAQNGTTPDPRSANNDLNVPADQTASAAPAPHAAGPPTPAYQVKKPRVLANPTLSSKSRVYDSAGPGYALLQAPRAAMSGFPADSMGNVDWVAALERRQIAPRATASGKGAMATRDDPIIMRNTREMPWVLFPHKQHTQWLACSNCHPRPFAEKAGSSSITMDDIMRGRQCGMCHGRVAFPVLACERCHSVIHPGSPKAWW